MSDSSEASEQPPFRDSLCHLCTNVRYVKTRTSTFVMCTAPDLPKYPPQPVRECAAFTAADRSVP